MTKEEKNDNNRTALQKSVSLTKIANELGCHTSTVSKYLAELFDFVLKG